MSLIFCLMLVVLGSTSVHGNAGSDGWVLVGGRYLKYFATGMNFQEANAVCGKLGGVIVYDNNPAIGGYLARKGNLQWIGATDAGHEGKWTWTNGASVVKGKWKKGEPNNCCGGQNCAVTNFRKPGDWDDQGCATKLPFHCQVIRPGYAYGVARRGFKVHAEKMSWGDAAKTCHQEGGELVKVNHPAVNAWLAKQDPKLGVLWIGATDQGHEGKFTFSDGRPAPTVYWSPGEPNNCCGGQNCALVNWKIPGKWDDQGCHVKHSFVCQLMI